MNNEMEIEKIGIVGNPRTSELDVGELTMSILTHGIIEPLVVDEKHNLIAGHRRLAAAKAAGLKTVPVVVHSTNNVFAVAMVENVQRKDLTQMEEARAYQNYMKKSKKTLKQLAGEIGKTEGYITRKLALLQLIPRAQKELESGKIRLGHAVLLSRLDIDKQAKQLTEILKRKQSVSEFSESLEGGYRFGCTADLEEALFDVTACKNCPKNGGQQCILDETGANLKGTCLSQKCFKKKTGAWIKAETSALKKKGITVLPYAKMRSNPKIQPLSSWEKDYDEIVKTRLAAEPEVFAVAFDSEGYGKKLLFCLKPGLRTPKKKPQKGEAPDLATVKELNLSRKERIKNRIELFTRELRISVASANIIGHAGHSQQRAVTLYELMSRMGNYNEERTKEFLKAEGAENLLSKSQWHMRPQLEKALVFAKKKPAETERLIAMFTSIGFGEMETKNLEVASNAQGFKMEKHFKISEEFLNLHSVEQLRSLAKESKLELEGKKKTEVVQEILKGWKKNQLPKALAPKKGGN